MVLDLSLDAIGDQEMIDSKRELEADINETVSDLLDKRIDELEGKLKRGEIDPDSAILKVGILGGLGLTIGSKKLRQKFIINNIDKIANFLRNVKKTKNKRLLIDDLVKGGTKITPENVVDIRKINGKTVWLETGTASGPKPAGLAHITADHGKDFANKGISENQIPDALFAALDKGKVVGYQGKGTGRPIYEFQYNGKTHRAAITVGDNGFIVGANPQ